MARGDWNVVQANTSSSSYKGGFEWRYVNTAENAHASNIDVIEIKIFAKKSAGTGAYNLNNLTSYLEYTIGDATTKLNIITDYDFRSTSNTTFYLGTSLPFRRVSGAGTNTSPTLITIEIEHNQDGSAPSFSVKWYWNAGSTSIVSCTATAEIELDPILRGSTLNEISDFNISDDVNISINKYVASYIDNLVISIGTTIIKTINQVYNGYVLSFTNAEKNTIKSLMLSPQIIMRFTLSTYDGSTLVGTSIQDAICNDLSQPLLYTIHKNSDGYQYCINGVVNVNLENGLQIQGELYKNNKVILSEEVLFESVEGQNTDITLDDGKTLNHKRINIQYGEGSYGYGSPFEVDEPLNKSASLVLHLWQDSKFYQTITKLTFEEIVENDVTKYKVLFSNSARRSDSTNTALATSQIKIYKIIAYD